MYYRVCPHYLRTGGECQHFFDFFLNVFRAAFSAEKGVAFCLPKFLIIKELYSRSAFGNRPGTVEINPLGASEAAARAASVGRGRGGTAQL